MNTKRPARSRSRDFWVRRARRLLPALYVFLAGTVALAGLFASDAFDKVRRELLGALIYVSNWVLIAVDESYVEASGRPSLLRHLWSLAIEEQFYLIWPIVVWAGLRFAGRRTLLAFTLAGVAASTALLWMLFDRIEQYGDVSGVYYRTDARAAALLMGAALALVWRPWDERSATTLRPVRWQTHVARWATQVLGLAALVFVIVLNYTFTDRIIEWASYEQLYQGGFLAVSAATAIVIAVVTVPDSPLGWILGNPVMRWIGTRSYGLYLWHWPVFQLTRPRVDVDINGYALLGLRLAVTVVLVELSYRLVEAPIRNRRFVASVSSTLTTPRGILAATFGALGLIVATAAVAAAIPTIDRGPSVELAAGADSVTADGAPLVLPVTAAGAQGDASTPANADSTAAPVSAEPTATPPPTPTVDPDAAEFVPPALIEFDTTPSATAAPDAPLEFDPNAPLAALPEPTPTQIPLPPPLPLSSPFDIQGSQIHIVGDSVVAGAQNQLYRISPRVTIDAVTGRQWWSLENDIRAMRAGGLAGDVVVIQIGNNGNFTHQMFDGVMSALEGTRLVLFVNIHAPVVWESEVNATLAYNVSRYPDRARLLDWYSASINHPEYFVQDGTHLQGPGMVAFRSLIESALLSLQG